MAFLSCLISTFTNLEMQKWTYSRIWSRARKNGITIKWSVELEHSGEWGRNEKGWKGNREGEELGKDHEFRLPNRVKGQ